MLRTFFFIFLFNSAVKDAFGRSPLWEDISLESDEIIGGQDVDIKQYPHQVSVLRKGMDQWCGGSILSADFVLTAAHCVFERDPTIFKIRAGSTYYNKDGKVYDALSIIIHPQYSKPSALDYDVAVVKTQRMALDGVTTRPVQLAGAGSALKPGDNIVVAGWGVTAIGISSKVLQGVTLPVVGKPECVQMWSEFKGYEQYKITERMFCAGFEKPDRTACHGDSGSPALAESSNIQYGIVSFGAPGCQQPRVPNVYTNIPAVRDWIRQTTGV